MNILYISGSPPYPINIGGNQLAAQRYRALAELGAVDLFLALDPQEIPASHLVEIQSNYRLVGMVAPLRRGQWKPWSLLRSLAPPWADRLADYLSNRRRDYLPDPQLAPELKRIMAGTKYDAVVATGLDLAMKTGISPDFPFVLDVNDTPQEWFESQIHSPCSGKLSKGVAAWRWNQLKQHLPDLYRRFRHCWVIKPGDIRISGLEHASWLGISFFPPDGGWPSMAPSDPASRSIVMVGSYYHRPNAEGLDWFIHRVWPRVKAAIPEAEFRIIGPGLSPQKAQAYGRLPGVQILGVVRSTEPHYRECAFSLAPIWTGAGINLKVMESYAYGRTCVLTPFAYRGYDHCLEPETAVLVAGNPEDYARCCADLLRDPVRRDRLAVAGSPRIQQMFSYARMLGEMRRLESLVAGMDGSRGPGDRRDAGHPPAATVRERRDPSGARMPDPS